MTNYYTMLFPVWKEKGDRMMGSNMSPHQDKCDRETTARLTEAVGRAIVLKKRNKSSEYSIKVIYGILRLVCSELLTIFRDQLIIDGRFRHVHEALIRLCFF